MIADDNPFWLQKKHRKCRLKLGEIEGTVENELKVALLVELKAGHQFWAQNEVLARVLLGKLHDQFENVTLVCVVHALSGWRNRE